MFESVKRVDPRLEAAKRKAQFCLATGVSPSEYECLKWYEINAFLEEVERRNKNRKGT